MKKIVRFVLVFVLLFVSFILLPSKGVNAAEVIHEGYWGDCPWTLDDEGTLFISGGVGENYQYRSITWMDYKDSIKKVIVGAHEEKVYFPINAARTFYDLSNVETISFVNVDTSYAQGMASLFLNCRKLKKIEGLNKFDTSIDDDMSQMFYNCEALEEVDLSSFNTSKIKETGHEDMFRNNPSLKKITFGENFRFYADDIILRDEDAMWIHEEHDEKYKGGDIASKSYNNEITLTGSWTYDDRMYWGNCLVTVEDGVMTIGKGTGEEYEGYAPDRPWWDIKSDITKVEFEKGVVFPESIEDLFYGFVKLQSVDFSNVDMRNVKDADSVFLSCYDLKSVNLKSTVQGGALLPESMGRMFEYCISLEDIDIGNINTFKVTDFHNTFYHCNSLDSIDLRKISLNSAENMENMFAYTELKSIDLSNNAIPHVVNISGLFESCNYLSSVKLPDNGIKASSLSYLFSDCYNLTQITNIDKIDGSSASSLREMFTNCMSLTSIDLSNINAKSFTDYRGMFSGCENLVSLDISGLDTTAIDVKNNGRAMPISSYPTVYGYRMTGMFDGCNNLDKIVVGEKTQLIGGPVYSQYGIDEPAGLPENTLDSSHKNEWYVTEPGNPENSGWKHIYNEIPDESIENPAYRIYRRSEDQTDPEIPELYNFGDLEMNSNIPATFEYTGDVIYPDLENVELTAKIDGDTVTLVKGRDYTVEYYSYDTYKYPARINEYRVGTEHIIRFYGKGSYTGVFKTTFTIVESTKKNIEACTVTWPEDMTCVYTGEECTPKPISVKDGERTLVENTDYEIKYYRNIDALQTKYTDNPPRVIILGKGEYSGNVNKGFSINERDINDAEIQVTLNKTYTETGRQIKPTASEITVKYGDKVLTNGYDWDISEYGDNIEPCTTEEEKAYVEIEGVENFTGYRKIYFDINVAEKHKVTIVDEKQGNLTINDVIDGTSLMDVVLDTKYYDVYYAFNDYVKVDDYALITLANKPQDSYTNFKQLYDDSILSIFGKDIDRVKVNSDVTLYAVYFKIIDKIEFIPTIPKCGETTDTSTNEYGYYDFDTQTNKPEGMIPEGSNYVFIEDYYPEEEPMHGAWHKKDERTIPFIGTFIGGETYSADYELSAKYGYVFDKDVTVEIPNGTLTGKTVFMIVSRYDDNSWMGRDINIDTDVVAEHDWNGGTITKAATETAEGIKTYTCKNCKLAKTEVIPKVTPSGADRAKQRGEDGTAYGKGASAEAVEAAILKLASDSDPAGTKFGLLQAKASKVKKNAITLKWTKPAGAVKYVVYGNACGKKNKMQRIAEQSRNSLNVKKVLGKTVKKGTYYKFIVVALDKNNNVVSTSKIIHIATKGGKVGNYKAVKLKNIKKNKLSLGKGKSKQIKAVSVKESKYKVKNHRKLSFESSDPTVATVNKKGKITAKKKGSCIVYAYSQGGTFAKIKVTVK